MISEKVFIDGLNELLKMIERQNQILQSQNEVLTYLGEISSTLDRNLNEIALSMYESKSLLAGISGSINQLTKTIKDTG